MSQHDFKMLIGGKLVAGESKAPVINPATEQPFADRPVATRAQLDEAVAAAKQAQPAWAALPVDERRAVLRAIADRIEAGTEDLARILTLEGGKPLRDGRAEIGLFVATIREVAKLDLAVEVIEDSETIRNGVDHVLSDDSAERIWRATREDPAKLQADMQAVWDEAQGKTESA